MTDKIYTSDDRGSLLIVDDEKEVLMALKRLFRKEYDVHLAEDADKGLRIMSDYSIHVVISDQRMPGMPGTELLKRIKADYPDAVRVILTAYSDINAVIDAINEGNVYRYISKPWNPVEMRHTVKNAFIQYWLVSGNRKLLKELAEKNNALTDEIAERKRVEEELEKHQANLEQMVEERTAELRVEIAERKNVERQLAKARDEAQSASQAKSDFLAHMSHELRTPLNGIIGYSQILMGDSDLSIRQSQAVEVIRRSGEHLFTMIDDILDLAKIEARKMELEPSAFHLGQLLNDIVEMTKIRSDEKNLALDFRPPDALPAFVRGDPKRLRQVLLNLLSNAVKYSDIGGVVFKVRHERPDMFSFSVEDTGIGIPEGKIGEIFMPFHQVADRRRQTDGTGLGLSISQRIVEMMGGKIGVKSKLLKGSVFGFEIRLPIVARSPDLAGKPKRIIGYEGRRRKILIVDDRKDNRAVLADILEQIGFDICEARDGHEALDKTAECRPEFIMMDLVMPNMDGYEAARGIRKKLPDLNPVIFAVSANVTEAARQKAKECGCDDFISKPFDFDKLLQKIGTYLNPKWIYETTAKNPNTSEKEVKPPPKTEIEKLYEMARIGDLDGIGEWVEAALPEYAAFGQLLGTMVRNFQTKQIKEIICRYL